MMFQFPQKWISDIDAVQREMSRLLEHLATTKPPEIRFSPTVWEPALDLYETDNELLITIELAGVQEDDFHLLVDHNTFTIRGERKKILPDKTGAYHRMEISSGHFEKSITLPVPVDASSASASYDNGLVEIVLPKIKERRTVRVEIKVR